MDGPRHSDISADLGFRGRFFEVGSPTRDLDRQSPRLPSRADAGALVRVPGPRQRDSVAGRTGAATVVTPPATPCGGVAAMAER